jgi:hypothetical protein
MLGVFTAITRVAVETHAASLLPSGNTTFQIRVGTVIFRPAMVVHKASTTCSVCAIAAHNNIELISLSANVRQQHSKFLHSCRLWLGSRGMMLVIKYVAELSSSVFVLSAEGT